MSPLLNIVICIVEFINVITFPIYLLVKANSLFHSNAHVFYITGSIYLGFFFLLKLIIIKQSQLSPDKKYLFKLNFIALSFSDMVGIILLYSQNMYFTKGFIAIYLLIMTRCIDPNSFWIKGTTTDNDNISNIDNTFDINGARDYR
ncbi:4214_t:CDS:1 [Scutellospora calospora]|uniref:4214_t:CDS:1 n=1 Tax=Scutellospora calospora TaxID=85575 RepID=A0ACA9LJ84_9GLOM|nr:4214_t:CDS:1 [Scutellospora calospora]